MIKKAMKLVDPRTGEMECKVCGVTHWAQLKSSGRYYRGAWKCKNGCTLDSSAIGSVRKKVKQERF
jgi:hypothetical protein